MLPALMRAYAPSWASPYDVGLSTTTIIRGTAPYGGVAGYTDDIPQTDLSGLTGWLQVALVGTTAQRPLGPTLGQWYLDLTLNLAIIFDNSGVWRNPMTGAQV